MISHSYSDFMRAIALKRLIIFGAGRIGNSILNITRLYPDVSVWAFVDNNKAGSCIHGIEIQSVTWLLKQDFSDKVLIIATKKHNEIEEQLSNLGFNGSIFSWPLLLSADDNSDLLFQKRHIEVCYSMYEKLLGLQDALKRTEAIRKGELFVIPRLPVMITTRCTLRCKDCSNLIPSYKNPKDYNANEVCKWLDRLFTAVDECISLELVGGEPFLHPKLEKILNYVILNRYILQIELTTNGTIVPTKEVLLLLSNPKVTVYISDYGSINSSEKIVNTLKEYGVKYSIHKDMTWVDMGGTYKRNNDDNATSKQYLNCNMSVRCRSILNGRLYACSRAASLAETGIAPDIENVDLQTDKELREHLLQFLNQKSSNACDYCGYCYETQIRIKAACQCLV